MSIQAAMNQLLGSAGSLAYQITAPSRYAKAQTAEVNRVRKLEEDKAKIAVKTAKETEEAKADVAAETAKKNASNQAEVAETAYEAAQEAYSKAGDGASNPISFMKEVSRSSGKVVEEATKRVEKLRALYEVDSTDEDAKNRYLAAEDNLRKAQRDARIADDIAEFMTTEAGKRQAEYQLALSKEEAAEEGYDTLEALELLRSQGAFKSNTQYKKAAYRLKQGGKI